MGIIRVQHLLAFLFAVALGGGIAAQVEAQAFAQGFSPTTIGANSTSQLTFTIENTGSVGMQDVEFSKSLPAGLTLVGAGSTNCASATLTAPDGGTTITLTGGQSAPGNTCTTVLNVTGSAAGSYSLGTTDLFADGNLTAVATAADATMTIDATRVEFSKSLSASTLTVGDDFTVTYTITNPSASTIFGGFFNETFPADLPVSSPSGLTSDCPGGTPTATGESVSVNSVFLAASASCTISINLVATNSGDFDLTSSEFIYNSNVSAGASSAGLMVNPISSGGLALTKAFDVNQAVAGQKSVEITFTVFNSSATEAATDLAFSDDLDGFMSGVTALDLPVSDVCGTGSLVSGSSTITFSGGSLPPRSSCSFGIAFDVPAATHGGDYTNTTSTITGDLGGDPAVGAAASDTINIIAESNAPPNLSKTYLEVGSLNSDPSVPAGDNVLIEFTIENTSTTSAATDIAFTDELISPSSMTIEALPADGFCGAGSAARDFLISGNNGHYLSVSGGNLAAGASCTFQITVGVPDATASGTYNNTTSDITATVGGVVVTGEPASDDLTVVKGAELRFAKTFTDSVAQPNTVTELTFTIEHLTGSGNAATAIAFTDDLDAFHAGATFDALVSNGCGGTISASGSGNFEYSNGSLAEGASCSIVIDVLLGGSTGSRTNTTSELTASAGGLSARAPAASDGITISSLLPLVFSMDVTDDPVAPGGAATLEFTLTNPNAGNTVTGAFFTLDLPSALAGLASTSGTENDICGSGSSISGTTFLIFTGGDLAPSASCTFSVALAVPSASAPSQYSLQSSSTSSSAGTGNAANADLIVEALELGFEKSFDRLVVTQGNSLSLEFTLTNPTTQAIGDLAFTDDLDAMLTGSTASGLPTAGTVCGTGTVSGTSILSFSGGSLAAGASCNFSITVQVPASASEQEATNVTSVLTGDASGQLASGPVAQDSFYVVEVETPTFTKTFLSSQTTATGTTTMRIEITNTDLSTPLNDLGFSDDLSAFISGATAISGIGTDICGAGSSLSGTTNLVLSGGNLAPDTSCSFDIDIQIPSNAAPGTFTNTTSVLASRGTVVADAASDDLTIEPAPTFQKAFSPDNIGILETSTLSFTIDNAASALAASALAFTDSLPAGMEVASTPGVSNNCGGTATASAGTGTISISGGNVGAGASCTLQVSVQPTASGVHVNTTGDFTSSSGNSGTASDTLTVQPAPSVSLIYLDNPVAEGAASTLQLGIQNAGSTLPATSAAVSINLPAGLQVASPASPTGSCGGTLTAPPGATSVSFSGGSVAGGASCDFSVEVLTSADGSYPTSTGDLTTSLGNSGTASDTLTVSPAAPPLFSKAFAAADVVQGATTILTFTIDNTAALVAADALAFELTLPAGLTISTDGLTANTCGGTPAASVGGDSVQTTGGAVGAGATCILTVGIQTSVAGTVTSTTGDFTSSQGNSGTATDDLNVIPATVPAFSLTLSPDLVAAGETSVATFVIDNSTALVTADNLAFTLPLTGGVTVSADGVTADNCNGTVTATPGANSITLSGGSIAAGGVCSIDVGLETSVVGTVGLTTGDLTSSLGNSGTAGASLSVTDAPIPLVAISFDPASVSQGATPTLSIAIDNTAAQIAATSVEFILPLIGGLTVSSAEIISNTCGGNLSASADATAIALRDGSVMGGATCLIEVGIQTSTPGTFSHETSDVMSSLGNSGKASTDLEVTPAPTPTLGLVFNPSVVAIGDTLKLSLTIDNSGALIAANGLEFSLPLFGGLTIAADEVLSNSCGGVVSAPSGGTTISLTGGSVADASVCTIEISIQTSSVGDFTLATGDLVSSLGFSGSASAVIQVIAAVPPVIAMSFNPATVDQGATTVIELSIDNSANFVPAEDLAVTVPLSGGLTVSAAQVVSNSCGGSVSATGGAASFDLMAGTLAAGATCLIEIGIQTTTPGSVSPVSGEMTSSLGNSGTATATLEVSPAPTPTLSARFDPDSILTRQTSVLTVEIDNTAALVAADSVAFDATLPAGVTFLGGGAVTQGPGCGGAVSVVPNDTSLSASVSFIEAGQVCAISATVQSDVVGVYIASAGPAATSLGTTNLAAPQLSVEQAPEGTLSIIQNSNEDGSFVFTSATTALNFTIVTSGGTGAFGPVFVPSGTHVVAQMTPGGMGTEAITCTDADSIGDPDARELTAMITPGENLVCTFDSLASRQKTIDEINNFLTSRGSLILSTEPGSNRRFGRLRSGFGGATQLSYSNGDLKSFLPFSYDYKSAGTGNHGFSTSWRQMRMAAESLGLAHGDTDGIGFVEDQRWDVWFEGTYKRFETDSDADGHFAIGYIGADYLVNQDVLVGVMLQFDDTKLYGDDSTTSGTGWMAGPYLTARLSPQLLFDGRISAGRSSNRISPFNTYTDDFETTRWLANASLSGEIDKGPWVIRPTASVSYFEETQNGYTDGLGVGIPSQTVSVGEVKLGPTVSGKFIDANGITYRPEFGLNAIYQHSDTTGVSLTNEDAVGINGWRGRLKAGVTVLGADDAQVSLAGTYDGLGSDFRSWGIEVQVEVPLR